MCKRYYKHASDCDYTVISLICLELAIVKNRNVLMKIHTIVRPSMYFAEV